MNRDNVDAIEIGMEEAKQAIKDRNTLVKLQSSTGYKQIFGKMYMKEEPVRLVGLKSVSSIDEDHVDKLMYGIGSLEQFLRMILEKGNQAELAIKEFETVREELIEEGIE